MNIEHPPNQVFAAVGCTQAFFGTPVPLFYQVYKATLEWHPGFVFYLCSSVVIFMMGLVMYCIWLWKEINRRKLMGAREAVTDNRQEISKYF